MKISTGRCRWPTAALVLTGILGSACTPNPLPSPPTVLSSPNGRSTAIGGGEQSAVATGRGMTPVPESSLCASTVDLAADAVPFRPDAIWPGPGATSFNASRTVSRHRTGCAARLPAAPDCTVGFPFTVQGNDEVVLAFALDRLVTGEARVTVAASPAGATSSQRIISYHSMLRQAGAAGEAALAWLRSAVATCVGGRPGRLGGTSGLVGSVSSPNSPSGRARSLFVVSGGLAIWLVLDGGAWSPASDRRAVDAAVLSLRSEGTSTIG
ncbi:MAG: hypothetical protein ABIQ53_03950 [Terracoccus sp.]